MCGIYTILNYSGNDIYKLLINGLFHLQHRGQESAGITLFNKYNNIKTYKSHGLLKNLIKKINSNNLYDSCDSNDSHISYDLQNSCDSQISHESVDSQKTYPSGYIGFGHLRYSTNMDKTENCISHILMII